MKNHHSPSNCQACSMQAFCLPIGLPQAELEHLEDIVEQRMSLQREQTLCQAGDKFQHFYAVQKGALKSVMLNASGEEQIIGFYLPGEVIGFEAFSQKKYPTTLIAITETLVCQLPQVEVMRFANQYPSLQHQILNMASQRLNADISIHYANAEQKIVAFLLTLAERLKMRKMQAFELPMSRQDIGNHLGLAMETVSRHLSELNKKGFIQLRHRSIQFRDIQALCKLIA